MDLSIIIVNFNSGAYLHQCLSDLFKYHADELIRHKIYEVIVLDNASREDIMPFVADFTDKIKLIRNKQNLGFAKANNLGIRHASGRYIMLLNPDTRIEAAIFRPMIEYLDAHPRVAVLSPRIVLPDGKIDDASHRGFPTPWRALTHFSGLGKLFPHSLLFNGYHLGYRQLNQTHEIEACVGAAMLIRRDAGEQLGWLDEEYFWYGEDLDFCYRIRQAGYQVVYFPRVSLTHYKGVTSGIKSHSRQLSQADMTTRRLATAARFDVMRIFYRKHYMKRYPAPLTWLVLSGIRIKQTLSEIFL